MGINHQPVLIGFDFLHKQVRNYYLRENVVGFHSLVAVFGTEFQKVFNIQMPHIQGDGDGSLAFSLLVYSHGGVVNDANPRNDAAG